jgi:predicted alpha/beta hydrolase family esterase
MKIIILPGYSVRNREWGYEVKDGLKDHGVYVHEWRHWKDKSLSLSLKYEKEQILERIGKERINIIAKSVGTRVAMHLMSQVLSQVNKLILCGIPTRGKSEAAMKTYTKGFSYLKPDQVICFQNKKDPLASYSDIEKFIHSINSTIKIIEMPRSDHHYPYTEDFKRFLD